MIYKVLWMLRCLLYKPFFGSFKLPSYIGRPIFIHGYKNIFISKKVRIFPNSRIEVINNKSSIHIKSNVSIGQNFHITSGGKLIIGENTTITENVMITNIDHEYQHINKHILSQPYIIKKTLIGRNCFIGCGAAIQAGTILGKQCIVGSNSVVRGTFPNYCVIVGAPARIIKRYDKLSKTWRKTDSKGNFVNE